MLSWSKLHLKIIRFLILMMCFLPFTATVFEQLQRLWLWQRELHRWHDRQGWYCTSNYSDCVLRSGQFKWKKVVSFNLSLYQKSKTVANCLWFCVLLLNEPHTIATKPPIHNKHKYMPYFSVKTAKKPAKVKFCCLWWRSVISITICSSSLFASYRHVD